jgi:cephalosporin hydroxylase
MLRSFVRNAFARAGYSVHRGTVNDRFLTNLLAHTDDFGGVHWLGTRMWQNPLDAWVIQETIAEVRPSLLIECGTNRGGAALFYAHLFDLLDHGRVVTIDVERLHTLNHPRVRFIEGSSVAESTIQSVRDEVATDEGPIMVILDSDHTEAHVAHELELYAPLVTIGSYVQVQDGAIDTLPEVYRGCPPGPYFAVQKFLKRHPEFVVDRAKCEKFLITKHPHGWLRRVR